MSLIHYLNNSSITTDVDFDKEGIQHGYLYLPYSTNRSAWGSLRFPIACIKRGKGKSILMTAGNHGDEYEGMIGILSLIREIDFNQVNGTIILLPFMNYPAVLSAMRISPLDNKNMNRIFPGDHRGTPTEKIAAYITDVLLPRVEIVLDMHSGGKSLNFVSFVSYHKLADKKLEETTKQAALTFNAPYCIQMIEMDERGLFDTEVEKTGKIFITTELGGGGTATLETSQITKQGIRSLLNHFGILPQKTTEASKSIFAYMPETGSHIISRSAGILDTFASLGDSLKKNQKIAQVYSLQDTYSEPYQYQVDMDCLFLGRHHCNLIEAGDCLAVLAKVAKVDTAK